MKTTYQKVLCVAVLLGSTVAVSAQEDADKKKLDREMTLEREYAPTVQDANKVNTLPAIKEPAVQKRAIDFSPFTLATEPEKQITLLPSGNIMTQMEYNKRRGYLNLGAGMRMNFNGDFGYHILSTDKDKLNIFLSHRSMNGNVDYIQTDDKVKAKLNDNLGGLNFQHAFDKASLKMGIFYNYTGFNYYGLPMNVLSSYPQEEVMKMADRETNQVNQTVKANVGVEAKEDADFFYLIDLDYVNFSHKYGRSAQLDGPTEHTLDVKFDFNAGFNGNQRVGVGGQVEYFAYSLPTYPEGTAQCAFANHAEVTLTPYYKIEGENWRVKLGANVMFVTGEESSFTASPNVAADVEVADKTVLYLKADGRLYSNSAYEMSKICRYVDPAEELAPTRNWLNGQFGLKSGVAPGFWFDVFAGYKINSSDLLYVPSRNYIGSEFGNFVHSMTDIDTKCFFAGANLKYSYASFLDIHLKGGYNSWKGNYGDTWVGGEPNAELSYVYGKPKMELTAGVTVRPIHQLAIDANYYLATDRYTSECGIRDVKLNNINELNFQIGYTFNDTFGVYVKGQNLLNQHYEMFYGYPMQGITLMGGVNINF